MATSQQHIALIDCNSFFCSCELIFRPDLWDKPVVVLSSNDGCAISRTPQAKKIGIAMGEPYFRFRHLHEKKRVHIFSANFSLYRDISWRVMNKIKSYTDKVEVYSIDEAFADLSGIKDINNYALSIKQNLLKEIGIPVSIGIAPTKVLAKVANAVAKKQIYCPKAPVINLSELNNQKQALQSFPISEVWGIGKQSSEKLRGIGIHTTQQFAKDQRKFLIQKLLGKSGLQIQDELNGTSCLPLEISTVAKKQIQSSQTYQEPILSLRALQSKLADHMSIAAEKMRRQKSVCSHISIYARTDYFNPNIKAQSIRGEISLYTATADTLKLIHHALELAKRHWQQAPYKKIGVSLSHLIQTYEQQLDLFQHQDSSQSQRLMEKIDIINHHYGSKTIMSAVCTSKQQPLNLRRDYLSPRYTTNWRELPQFGD